MRHGLYRSVRYGVNGERVWGRRYLRVRMHACRSNWRYEIYILLVNIIFKNTSIWQMIVAFLPALCYCDVLLLNDVIYWQPEMASSCKRNLCQTFNAASVIDSKF